MCGWIGSSGPLRLCRTLPYITNRRPCNEVCAFLVGVLRYINRRCTHLIPNNGIIFGLWPDIFTHKAAHPESNRGSSLVRARRKKGAAHTTGRCSREGRALKLSGPHGISPSRPPERNDEACWQVVSRIRTCKSLRLCSASAMFPPSPLTNKADGRNRTCLKQPHRRVLHPALPRVFNISNVNVFDWRQDRCATMLILLAKFAHPLVD